jgi:predicted nucleic acid-binding protein
MSVFVDTSAFLAVLDAEDRWHESAKQTWEELLSGDESLVCSNYVLVEAFAVVQRRLGMEAARTFHEDICPVLSVEWVDESSHRAGLATFLAAGRRQLSLVDCTSFELMRRCGISKVFCFDPHFREAGFELVRSGQGS